ncbi:hypothetical protein E2562_022921 [Oryza meyeriana var. granulata]|uniref:EF-hand domain-containing protein n=1 Tax=Oryza meyeriana var. granulata TaxID=110450 RepID=A0A6G1D8I4_9ORYZ|nr:hypothetical protein E2562_022921 [Oryza meyeriana var. granulata]
MELREAIRRRGARFASLKAWFYLYLADKNGNGFVDDDEIWHLMDLAEKDLKFKMSTSPAAGSTCLLETTYGFYS